MLMGGSVSENVLMCNMTLNKQYQQLLAQNWFQAHRTAERLSASLQRLKSDMPLTLEKFCGADDLLLEKLDAFRVRFTDLQDCLGGKVFKSILLMEDEEPINMADTLNRMEKRGIIESVDQWRRFREIRNAFAHDYPEAEAIRVEAINQAWYAASVVLGIAQQVCLYCGRQGVGLTEIRRADL